MKTKGYDIKKTVWKLTIKGMLKYGLQLSIVELLTMFGIYMIRIIIDFLHDKASNYGTFTLFFWFGLVRLLAILIRV